MDIKKEIKSIDINNIVELKNLYNILIKDNDKDYLDYLFYSLKKYEHTDEFIQETEETIQETTEERIKRKDTQFRKAVIEKYKRCIITNKPLKYCQVAHIYPYALSDETEKYDPENALLLCSDFHIGFDHTYTDFIINPNLKCIELSESILSDLTMSEYHKYHNKKIELSDKNIYYLKKKYNL
jgi:hypothetical protein